MNVLIFEWKNFGIEDICDAFKDMAIKYKCISTELMRERKMKNLIIFLKMK